MVAYVLLTGVEFTQGPSHVNFAVESYLLLKFVAMKTFESAL